MFENKKINMVIAIICATLLWAYVIGSINPTAQSRFTGIPVTLTNTEVLENKGLAVSSCSVESVDLLLSGSRSDISKLSNDDISAIVDLSNALEGENEFTIDIYVPDGIDIEQRSVSRVVVKVELLTTAEVDVDIVYTGDTDEGSEVMTTSVSQDTVTVRGAESLVNMVDAARGTIEITRVGDEESEISCALIAVDESGIQVENVRLSQSSVTVTAFMAYSKTVSLDIQVTDESDDDLERTWTGPEEIVICGKAGLLDDIDSIEAEIIDITDITEDTRIEVVPVLPEGIYISGSNGSLTLTVTVREIETEAAFTFTEDDIILIGTSEDISYTIEEMEFTVTVTGTASELDSISDSDITIEADVTGITQGESVTVNISVTISNSELSVSVVPESITVTAG